MTSTTKTEKYLVEYAGAYKTDEIELNEGLYFNQFKALKLIDYLSNSEYMSGKLDAQGRYKPFYNIVNANVDVAITATDFDRKDITLVADNADDYEATFLLNKELYQELKQLKFGKFLNKMGETRARYGGVLVKKTVDNGDLKIEVVKWKNAVTDQIDVENGVIIEKHYLSPSEMLKMDDVWDNTLEAVALVGKKKHGGKSEVPTGKIEIWEASGEMPDDDGDGEYRYRKMYLAHNEGKFVFLYEDDKPENNYKYLPWKEVDGRGLGRGVVEEGTEAQVWTNDAIIAEQRAMELSGKVVLETDDPEIESNVMDVDNGHILTVQQGRRINVLNLMNGALPQFQNLADKWQSQYDKTTAVTDSLRGETPPSGQAFRLQALVTQQSASQFDYRREEAGLFLEEIVTDWILPHLVKRLNKGHTLSDSFTAEELRKIDESYVNARLNKFIVESVLTGNGFPAPEVVESNRLTLANRLSETADQRFVDIPKDYYKDVKYKVSVITTGEQKNKMATLETLSNILTSVSSNPAILQDPVLADIFGEILELSGVGGYRMGASLAQPQKTESPVEGTQKSNLDLPQPQAQQNG
jgi:hypothetical protein